MSDILPTIELAVIATCRRWSREEIECWEKTTMMGKSGAGIGFHWKVVQHVG